jgi:hypothetical protein
MSEAVLTRRGPGRPKKKRPQGRQFHQITVLLPPDLVATLDAQAEAEGLDSRSDLIRRACGEYLRRREKRRARGESPEDGR